MQKENMLCTDVKNSIKYFHDSCLLPPIPNFLCYLPVLQKEGDFVSLFFFDARTGSITSECLMFWQSSSKSLSTGRNTHATNTILHEKNLFIWNAFFFWWTKSIRFLKQYNLLNQISAWIILTILKPFYIASHKNP